MGLFGTLLAGNVSKRAVEAFRDEYKRQFGSNPPYEALDAISAGATVIGAFAGTGREALGAERLGGVVDSYVRAVGRNDNKIMLGIGLLASMCMRPDGSTARGYQWAINVLNNKSWEYLPHLG